MNISQRIIKAQKLSVKKLQIWIAEYVYIRPKKGCVCKPQLILTQTYLLGKKAFFYKGAHLPIKTWLELDWVQKFPDICFCPKMKATYSSKVLTSWRREDKV